MIARHAVSLSLFALASIAMSPLSAAAQGEPEPLPSISDSTTITSDPLPGDSLPGDAVPADPMSGTGVDGRAIDGGVPQQATPLKSGNERGPEILPGVLDSQIQKCWTMPLMKGDIAEGGIARIRVSLSPDGSLASPPAIIDKPAGNLGLVFAESAATAITKCAPYTLPPEQYESWKSLMLEFDTLDF